MKAFLRVLITASVLFLIWSGCDSDDGTSLNGTWKARSMLVMFDSGGFDEQSVEASWFEEITLNKDGSYAYRWSKNGRSGTGSGTWTQEDGALTFTENNRTERIPYTLSGKQLVLSSAVPRGNAQLIFKK